jgi:hypothetical protein
MRKTSLFVFAFFIISFFPVLGSKSYAQFNDVECPSPTDIKITPSKIVGPCDMVDESVPHVKMEFTNLPEPNDIGDKYFYCLKGSVNDCGKNDWKDAKITSNATIFTIDELCGDGANALKTKCKPDGSDWFHAGRTYRVHLAQGENSELSASDVSRVGAFYVRHFYPTVVQPFPNSIRDDLNIDTIKNTGATITVILQGHDPKGGGKSNLYNDYFLQVISRDSEYKTAGNCIFIPQGNPTEASQGKTEVKLPIQAPLGDGRSIPLSAGNYILRIKDGIKGNEKTTNTSCREGEFTYYDIPFSIGAGESGKIGKAIADPYGKETFLEGEIITPPPVCPTTAMNKDGYCTSIQTGLGTIYTEPKAFVGSIFRIVLVIGGIAAIVFLIQAGYTLMTSAGNKEKVGAAREQITAAVMGLIFIILSIAILEFIGIDILQIPGFTR